MTELPQADTADLRDIDLPYRINWRASGVRIGAHRGKIEGSGGLFRGFDLLMRSPDPRRIDLRSSLRDPFENIYVKKFEQKASITVYALVDLSASMGFRGGVDRMKIVADLIGAVAASSRRVGDSFGLIGCAESIIPEFFLPATRSRGGEADMVERLRSYHPSGRDASGLIEGASFIAGRRKLVFVISDFRLRFGLIETLFEALAQHETVPIVLKDRQELLELPSRGLLTLADPETGRKRLVFMRPRLRDEWIRQEQERDLTLQRLAARYGRLPFEIVGPVDWNRLATYLMGGAA